jgi:hypothetical protein
MQVTSSAAAQPEFKGGTVESLNAGDAATLKRRIRWLLVAFTAGLAISGLTAVPLMWEINLLHQFIGPGTFMSQTWPAMAQWIDMLQEGITATARDYPFMLYGTDWLAFAHVVLPIAFIGPLRDPVRNVWVVELGLIACILVIPMALVFGPLRDIPFFWRLIDCSFGVIGFLPLWLVRQQIMKLQAIEAGRYRASSAV